MKLLLYGFPVLTGFVLGYFFATPVIIAVSLIAMIIAFVLRPKREQELGAAIGIIAWVVLGVGATAMWTTHLYVTGVEVGMADYMQYILRQ